jgi:MYXO-CTERM domain-containing protein
MKMRAHRGLALCAPLGLLMSATAVQAGVVTSWTRATDWVNGIAQGSTQNNPSPVGGMPTWQYEVVHGGALGSANPWYAQTGSLMTWDPAWYHTGWGVWSNGNDLNPPILPGRLIHNVHTSTFADIPLVRWLNPFGAGAQITVAGTLTINWNGVNGLGRPDDVDVVIARRNASDGSTSILYSTTVTKPQPFPSVGDSVMLPISLTHVVIGPGDSIVFTERGRQGLGPLGAWVNMYDAVTITAVPGPGSLALLGLGGLVAGRRRRR